MTASRLLPLALLLCFASPTWAEEASTEESEEHGFELLLQPYFFLGARTQGEASAGGIKQEVESKLSDLAEDVQLFSFFTRAELWTPIKLGIVADVGYLATKVREDVPIGLAGNTLLTEAETERVGLELFLGYRLIEMDAGPIELELAVLGGAAFEYLKITHEFVRQNLTRDEVDESSEWAELLLGLDVGVFLFDGKLGFLLRSSFGGFGIGSAPDLSWKFQVAVRWRPSGILSVEFGWIVDYLDLSRSRRGNTFAFEGFQHGPSLGIGLHF